MRSEHAGVRKVLHDGWEKGWGSPLPGQNWAPNPPPSRPSEPHDLRTKVLNNISEVMGSISGQAATGCAKHDGKLALVPGKFPARI
eukprot:1158916-Pelagomonas_calceolata.AAC.10